MNNSTLIEFCFDMIKKVNIEELKSNVVMNAWLSQVNYFCDNFSDIFNLKFRETKKSINHIFMICIHTENQNQEDFYSFVLLKIFVFHEFLLKHLRYDLTNVPPQSNFSFNNVFNSNRFARNLNAKNWTMKLNFVSLNK